MPDLITIRFVPSLHLKGTSLPTCNPLLPLPAIARFDDDGSAVLISTPLTITYPARHGAKAVRLHKFINWVRRTYLDLWRVQALEWYHPPSDAIVDELFKNPGDTAWRVSFSF